MSRARVTIVQNPWQGLVSADDLGSLLLDIAYRRACGITLAFKNGNSTTEDQGMVILNPLVPAESADLGAVLAKIVIGDDSVGENPLLEIAAAKALGDSRWGRASNVNGLVGGAYGLGPLMDRLQMDLALSEFSYGLARHEIGNSGDDPYARAYSTQDFAGERFRGVHSLPCLTTYVSASEGWGQPYFENPDGSPRDD